MSSTQLVAAVAGLYVAWRAADHRFGFTHDTSQLVGLAALRSFVADKQTTGWNVARSFVETAKKHATRESIVYEQSTYTFREVDEISNRVANWAMGQGLKFDDTVALVMENRPEFVLTWLGLTKVGVRIALINHNLRLGPLMHCIKVSNATWVLAGTELAQVIEQVLPDLNELKMNIAVIHSMLNLKNGEPSSFKNPYGFAVALDDVLLSQSAAPIPAEIINRPKFDDIWGYIYTSGTTGLPKAGIISHLKLWAMGASFAIVYHITEKDRLFTALPLYHSAGGGIFTSMMIYTGAPLCIARKFSASKFFQEAAEHRATVVQYIGELCRYLLASPPSPYEKKHRVRIAIGNGLRPDIWEQFQERFNVPEVGEFYGATEGNLALYNWCRDSDSRGFIGRQGLISRVALGAKLVKFDVEKEEPVRGKDGFCIECDYNEPGELITPVAGLNPFSKFNGYTDPKATEKKILRDAFGKGDAFFRTGDLLSMNERGFFSFVDRIGDTFRWKGENVSTTEVAEVLSKVPGILEANVYGVKVPGADGRACMAACVCSNDLNLANLLKQVKRELPPYAIPLFIRQLPAIEITGTFKHTKVSLREQGIDVSKVKDPMLWLSPISRQFEPFDAKTYDMIVTGKAKY